MTRKIALIFIHLFSVLFCFNHSLSCLETPKVEVYPYNPQVSQKNWDKLSPYFLPINFPKKAVLDEIFSKQRVIRSSKNLKKAGFFVITGPECRIKVAKHAKFPGYLFKFYLDGEPFNEIYWWNKRLVGAAYLRDYIKKEKLDSLFKVPNKWVYPLPIEPASKKNIAYPKNFILVVEDMKIHYPDINIHLYKKKITCRHLDALYKIIRECHLIDSVYVDNIPFALDGKIAFIDTEHVNNFKQSVDYQHLTPYFSKKMQIYWKNLIDNNLKK